MGEKRMRLRSLFFYTPRSTDCGRLASGMTSGRSHPRTLAFITPAVFERGCGRDGEGSAGVSVMGRGRDDGGRDSLARRQPSRSNIHPANA